MKLRRVLLESDLRCSFEGLRKLAEDIPESSLYDASVIFINRSMTAFKLLHKNAYLVYYKNGGRKIPLDAIIHLPEHFGGSELEMTAAVRKSVELKLSTRKLSGKKETS